MKSPRRSRALERMLVSEWLVLELLGSIQGTVIRVRSNYEYSSFTSTLRFVILLP